ncbi:UNVERIFIED_CONTAM: hypothetical protein HDU68_011796 [Siphonaria sp. JEL0065]|nr:hypothetical protein HDU68_011796 [Siphonaria sp. JEL0065]
MSSRVPPGGHSSISFGSYEQPVVVKTPQRSSPLLGDGQQPSPPATTGRKFGGVHKSSIVFGDSETPVAASVAVPIPSVAKPASSFKPVSANNIFAPEEPVTPVKTRTPVTVIPLEDPQPFVPSKRIIIPSSNTVSEEQKFVPGLRQGAVNHNLSSSISLGMERLSVSSSNEFGTSSSSSTDSRKLESSVVLGDDSPRSPEFGPRKHKPGVRLLKKEEPHRNLGEFSGYDGVEGKSSKEEKKVDPASVETVAGKNSGKHRVY